MVSASICRTGTNIHCRPFSLFNTPEEIFSNMLPYHHNHYHDCHAIPVHVEEPLVVVHPDLGHTSRVDPMRVVGDEVWVEWTEDVTNVAGE